MSIQVQRPRARFNREGTHQLSTDEPVVLPVGSTVTVRLPEHPETWAKAVVEGIHRESVCLGVDLEVPPPLKSNNNSRQDRRRKRPPSPKPMIAPERFVRCAPGTIEEPAGFVRRVGARVMIHRPGDRRHHQRQGVVTKLFDSSIYLVRLTERTTATAGAGPGLGLLVDHRRRWRRLKSRRNGLRPYRESLLERIQRGWDEELERNHFRHLGLLSTTYIRYQLMSRLLAAENELRRLRETEAAVAAAAAQVMLAQYNNDDNEDNDNDNRDQENESTTSLVLETVRRSGPRPLTRVMTPPSPSTVAPEGAHFATNRGGEQRPLRPAPLLKVGDPCTVLCSGFLAEQRATGRWPFITDQARCLAIEWAEEGRHYNYLVRYRRSAVSSSSPVDELVPEAHIMPAF